MTIRLEWLDEQKDTLIYRLESPITGIEIMDTLKKAYKMGVDTKFTTVIFDLTACNNVPMNILSSISTMKEYTTDSVNLRIIVGGSMLVTRFFNIIITLIPNMEKTVQTVDTMDEALTLVKNKKKDAQEIQ